MFKNGKILLYSTIYLFILFLIFDFIKRRGRKEMPTLTMRNDNLTILKEMEKSFADFKSLPEHEQKIIANKSLTEAGILDKKGYISKIYRNLGD